jgi:hypothetical protein
VPSVTVWTTINIKSIERNGKLRSPCNTLRVQGKARIVGKLALYCYFFNSSYFFNTHELAALTELLGRLVRPAALQRRRGGL